MKITDRKNEDALDMLAEIIEPAVNIFQDKEIRKLIATRKPRHEIAKIAIKTHKKEIIEILAALEGVPVEEFSVNALQMLKMINDIVSDEEMADFFSSLINEAEQTA